MEIYHPAYRCSTHTHTDPQIIAAQVFRDSMEALIQSSRSYIYVVSGVTSARENVHVFVCEVKSVMDLCVVNPCFISLLHIQSFCINMTHSAR